MLVGGELWDRRTNRPILYPDVAPVYEGDPGWEKVEAATRKADAEMQEAMKIA